MKVSAVNGQVDDRRPYTVVYYDEQGQKQTIQRRPPPRLHRLLPQDEVRITRKKSEFWDEGDVVTVTATTKRQPNTLRIEDGSGRHTFISHRDVEFQSRNGEGPDALDSDGDPIGTRYLLWP